MRTHENRTTRFAHSGVLQGAGGGVLGAFFGVMLQTNGYTGRVPLWIVAPLGAVAGYQLFARFTRALLHTSGTVAQQVFMPGAKGTYAPQHSHIQALEAQDRFTEARDAWLAVATEQPGNPTPLLRAADLELRQLRNAPVALELYERARRLPGANDETVRYASQKVIDIHLAPGGDTGRALVELRRFITMFPEGREADGARAALARLKSTGDA